MGIKREGGERQSLVCTCHSLICCCSSRCCCRFNCASSSCSCHCPCKTGHSTQVQSWSLPLSLPHTLLRCLGGSVTESAHKATEMKILTSKCTAEAREAAAAAEAAPVAKRESCPTAGQELFIVKWKLCTPHI